ncbi:MAG: hypothetical protein RIS52_622, partial [Pseudomonadota bacterium]
SNVSPDGISFPIPANDDASRAIRLYCDAIAEAATKGGQQGAAARGVDLGAMIEPPVETLAAPAVEAVVDAAPAPEAVPEVAPVADVAAVIEAAPVVEAAPAVEAAPVAEIAVEAEPVAEVAVEAVAVEEVAAEVAQAEDAAPQA